MRSLGRRSAVRRRCVVWRCIRRRCAVRRRRFRLAETRLCAELLRSRSSVVFRPSVRSASGRCRLQRRARSAARWQSLCSRPAPPATRWRVAVWPNVVWRVVRRYVAPRRRVGLRLRLFRRRAPAAPSFRSGVRRLRRSSGAFGPLRLRLCAAAFRPPRCPLRSGRPPAAACAANRPPHGTLRPHPRTRERPLSVRPLPVRSPPVRPPPARPFPARRLPPAGRHPARRPLPRRSGPFRRPERDEESS